MRTLRCHLLLPAAALVVGLGGPVRAQIVKKCPPDSVRVGNACIDTYEASVWQVPDPTSKNKSLVRKIERGKVTLGMLQAAGALQHGCTGAPFNHAGYPAFFPYTGNWTPLFGSSPPTPGIYAVSIPGVLPSTCTSQFQAEQACALAGKRLVTNAEWQRAAAGTPDPGAADDGVATCVTNSAGPANTGARTGCVSSWGVRDMVGNVWEWVADWTDRNAGCTNWSSGEGSDLSCFGGDGAAAFYRLPGAPIRGGDWGNGPDAGVFAVNADLAPADSSIVSGGLRCAR